MACKMDNNFNCQRDTEIKQEGSVAGGNGFTTQVNYDEENDEWIRAMETEDSHLDWYRYQVLDTSVINNTADRVDEETNISEGTDVAESDFTSGDETFPKQRAKRRKREPNDDSVVNEDMSHTNNTGEEGACAVSLELLNNTNSHRGHYCNVIWRSFMDMVNHMNRVDDVAGILFKHGILDMQRLRIILSDLEKNGPSSAVPHLLEVMYRDPNPEHHEKFYKALEETSQKTLANRLRVENARDNDIGVEQREATQNSSVLPSLDCLTQDKVWEQLQEEHSLVHTVIHFASTGIQGTLQSVDLNYLLEKLKDKSILQLKELDEIHNRLEDHSTGKIAALRKLLLLLQLKTKAKLIDFLHLLRAFPGTADLARWITIILNKCELVYNNQDIQDRTDGAPPASGIPVQVTVDSQGNDIFRQPMIDDFNREPSTTLAEMFNVEGCDLTAELECIQFSLVVKDQWELENLQKSIQCGLFTQRLRLWLRKHNYDITDEIHFETSLKIVDQGEKQSKVLAIHVENVRCLMESDSKPGIIQAHYSVQNRLTWREDNDVLASEKDGSSGIQTTEFAQSLLGNQEAGLWQKALAKHSFFICETLKDTDTLERNLADEQDEPCRNMLKCTELNKEVRVLILLKLAIYKSVSGYQKFLTFVKETGQSEIMEILPPSSGYAPSKTEKNPGVDQSRIETKEKEEFTTSLESKPLPLPSLDYINERKISKMKRKGNTLVHSIIHFAATDIEITLQSLNCKELLMKLKYESVLEVDELYSLMEHLDHVGVVACLRHLTQTLQSKTIEDLEDFLIVLQKIPATAQLAKWIEIIQCRCSEVYNSLSNKWSNDDSLCDPGLPVQVTTHSHRSSIPDEEIVSHINKMPDEYKSSVCGVEANGIKAEKKCVKISMALEDHWELQNLERSIQSGLYTQKYRLWLSKHGYNITNKTQFEITLALICDQGAGCMPVSLCSHPVDTRPGYRKPLHVSDGEEYWRQHSSSEENDQPTEEDSELFSMMSLNVPCDTELGFEDTVIKLSVTSQQKDDMAVTDLSSPGMFTGCQSLSSKDMNKHTQMNPQFHKEESCKSFFEKCEQSRKVLTQTVKMKLKGLAEYVYALNMSRFGSQTGDGIGALGV